MDGQHSYRRLTRAEFLRGAAGAGAALASASAGGRALAAAAAPSPFHRFHTRPDLQPLVLTPGRGSGPLADGYLFLTPSTSHGQQGTLIADNRGDPIWFNPTTPNSANNFRVASYRGRPVLTWWEGTDGGGLGRGVHVIADTSYRVIERLPAGNGLPSDLHEFLITPAGTAFVTSWESATSDLRTFGGPASGKVIGGVVQELELPSGGVLFEWHSLDHVALTESHSGFQRSYDYFDYFHVNSIAATDDGNLLVSARNTWGIYKLDRGSGEVIWRLGGKKSDYQMGSGTQFAWQHDARPHGDGYVSLFDDGAAPKVQPQSRGLVLALDGKHMRASLHRAYPHTPPLLAFALGNTQLLPNGNVLVGYGTAPHLTEFGPDGVPRLDLRLPATGINYRALRFPWTGRPAEGPRIAADASRLYASWNGATEVAAWRFETGRSTAGLAASATVPRAGFETAVERPPGSRYAAAVALDAAWRPLGRSEPLAL